MYEAIQVQTSDGAVLNILEAGSGQPLVMIPGWSQTAEQYKYQIDGLSDRYHCLAIDMRGHGDSENVKSGYSIHRLAKDVHDVILALDLDNAVLMGHSMGCSIIWAYWELFGSERLDKLILIDQAPFLTSNPSWSEETLTASGAIFDAPGVMGLCDGLAGPDGEATSAGLVGGMFTAAASDEMKRWVIDVNLKLPRQQAADLLYNHCHQDWRATIPTITVPTLIVSGRVSLMPWKSQQWIHEQIGGSQVVFFEEEEGGQHFMFIENPEKFNRHVREFLG